MKIIKRKVDEMNDEIHSAQKYAERAIEYKALGDNSLYNRFKEMSNEEIAHGMTIHQILVKDIENLSKVYTPPQDMLEKWEEAHARYIDKVAWIKQMLNM